MKDFRTLTAEDVFNYFVGAGIPSVEVAIYTKESDKSGMLGAPGKYCSKLDFDDLRNRKYGKHNSSIEVFTNAEDAKKRYDHFRRIYDSHVEKDKHYLYLKEHILVLISFGIVPSCARMYESVLDDIADNIDPSGKFDGVDSAVVSAESGPAKGDVIVFNKLTAKDIYDYFVEANVPCSDVVVYTEETDSNNLLGRPGSYQSKVNFNDANCIKSNPSLTVEVFENYDDAKRRMDYVKYVIENNAVGSLLKQYFILRENVLLRIPDEVGSERVGMYEAVLDDLVAGKDPAGKFEKKDYAAEKLSDKDEFAKTLETVRIMFDSFDKKDDDTDDAEPAADDENTKGYEAHSFGEYIYRIPDTWLFKGTKIGNYHYAKEIGSVDGGYIFCSKVPMKKRDIKSLKGRNSLENFESIVGAMLGNTIKGFATPLEFVHYDENIGIRFLSYIAVNGKELLSAHIVLTGEEAVYSFNFILEDMSKEGYFTYMTDFIDNLECKDDDGGLLSKIFRR